ncbi:non-ribosomal peptide synthetase [Bombardia bombarda]|uniref:Non-ribosomal peptide synthetase n=1 Tax=Bombardia bombarda TaxID=252184 RepID=A0AA39X8Q0_9PEZI|nr:non-ribosomal peptide synthetase [Bombardia bombarda]
MYGPTEAAIHCTLQPAFACNSMTGNIGMPLHTVSAFILQIPDEKLVHPNFNVLPQGEVGELAVGGYQLADGYLNRPEQTAKAFIDTPYGRLYRTGDKARMHADGVLECLGRIGEGQVKLRGQRIELGEIEHAALRTPGCHGAFAAVINNILVLFCAVDDTGLDMAATIQDSCKAWLPGYMVPGDIVVLREFPCVASGKIDRRGLKAEYASSREDGKLSASISKDELEQQLCSIVGEVLGVDIRSEQNLSRAGLDSLASIKLASRLREAGLAVSAIDILGSKTISALHTRIGGNGAASISEALANGASVEEIDHLEVVELHAGLRDRLEDIDAVFSCTPLQSSMLAETMADPRAYCNWVELAFPVHHAASSIRSWFAAIAQMNESLRTGFLYTEGRFLQVVFKKLGDSQVLVTDSATREFELHREEDFLLPFRVQIREGSDHVAVVVQLHHAVYDGWSMDMILSDLEKMARGDGPKPRPQYRQAAAYYQSASFLESCNAAKEFWAENLVSFQPPPLPNLRPDVVNSSTILSISIPLDASPGTVKAALKDIGCTSQALFQASLAWLWSSLVGSEDVVIGSVTSGRTVPIPRVEDIIGPCIAAVPLRTNLSQVRTIKDLLVSVHVASRALLPHIILPLSEIKQAAGLRPGQLMYDVLFVYQESLQSQDDVVRTITETAHQDFLETKLLVEIEPKEGSFVCRLTYYSDVFPQTQIELLGQQIQAVVSHMLGNLDSELTSIQQAFPRNLLSIYNQHPKSFLGVPDLAYAVEAMAAKFPTRASLCFADSISDDNVVLTTTSFEELNKTANRIARYLQERGAHEGGVVAIVMEKSTLLYAGILAILKVGCAYLPLLPTTPIARVDTIFRHAEVKICLVDTTTEAVFGRQLPCEMVDLQLLKLQNYSDSNLGVSPNPSRPSYVIYTSGSTGIPKGVCVTQLNIMSNLDVLSRIYQVKEDSRLLQSCSQAFDVSVSEIFFAWTQGICLCSATNDTLFEDLERSIRKLNVTHLSMTPTVASLVDPTRVPGIEFLVTSGEAMTESVARKWNNQLYQGYGPSETTNICSVKKMGPDQIIQHLGWSFENTSTFVLFRDSTDVVPLGCFGELCFGGDQVAQGYLNMPELTASKFINHPAYGRLYRSGDVGRMLPDGSMVIIGRMDDQIKLRGQRIELDEINSTIRQSNEVVDCATLFLRPDGPSSGEGQICAFVVPKIGESSHFQSLEIGDGLKQEIQTLFRLMASKVPAYMVPSYIIPISVLPTTASGKLDRRRLGETVKQLEQDYLALASPSVESHQGYGDCSDLEWEIVEIVSNVFNVGRGTVRTWTPLTTLGLDSISAIGLSKMLQVKFGKRLPISKILQNASVARLAQALDDIPSSTATLVVEQVDMNQFFPREMIDAITKRFIQHDREVERILPCTPLQEAMLAASDSKGKYLNKMLFKINGDLGRMKEAWMKMCERHGILRTSFVSTEDAERPIVQVVLKPQKADSKRWQEGWLSFEAAAAVSGEAVQSVDGMLATKDASIASQALSSNSTSLAASVVDIESRFTSTEYTNSTEDNISQHASRTNSVDDVASNYTSLGSTGDCMTNDACQIIDIEECISQHASTLANAIDAMEPVVSFATITQGNATYLSFICHHALYDGVAIERLLFEVEQVLSGGTLPPAPIHDLFLKETSLPAPSRDAFWLEHLAGHEQKLVTTHFKFENSSPLSSIISRNIDLPLSHIHDKTKHLGVSLLSFTQSAWAVTLSCLLRTSDVCFGNVVSGRSVLVDHIDELVAPCFNTIPTRMDMRDLTTNMDLMKKFQELNPRLLQHQFTPLRRIRTLVSKQSKNDGRLLFDTLLLLQRPPRELDGAIWGLERDEGEMDVPIVCEVIPNTQSDLLVVNLHLEPQRFSQEMAKTILDLFFHALRSCLQYPASHFDLFDVLPEYLIAELTKLPFDNTSQLINETSHANEVNGDWTTTESLISATLSKLSSSNPQHVRRQTTIYQLGLDSISAVQIASMLRKQGFQVSASDVIDHPTCAALARHLDAHVASSDPVDAPYDTANFRANVQDQLEHYGISSALIQDIMPCTPLQAGMMTQFIQSGGHDYFNYLDFQIHDSVDMNILANAWRVLYETQPILRTRFVAVDHDNCAYATVQVYADANPTPLAKYTKEASQNFLIDKWRLDVARNAIVTTTTTTTTAKTQGALWSVAIVETDRGIMMHLAIHHCLYDAHSLQLLLGYLVKATRGKVIPPPPATSMVVADILGQISRSTTKPEEFWTKQASSAVINGFPVMTPLRETPRKILVRSIMSSLPLRTLEEAVSMSGYPLQVVLQSAWARVLSSYLGEPSVVFGVVLSGRNTEVTQAAVFPCITTLPVVSTNTSSNRDLLKHMLRYNTELYKQQHQPLARIQQWMGYPNSRLFDTLLVYQKLDIDISETRPWTVINDQATVDYPVSIEIEPQGGDELKYQITFFGDVLPSEQADLLLEQFDAMVRTLALEPEGNEENLFGLCPELFSVLPAEKPELQPPSIISGLPIEDNESESSVGFLHQFVESQALKTPDKTALYFADGFDGTVPVGREWTYEQLDQNGNRVAQMLVSHTHVGDIVAIYFEKCPEAFFSILGVLKAGCSFVALDPGAPSARNEFILSDSGAALLLTSEDKAQDLSFRAPVLVLTINESLLASQSSAPPATSRPLEQSDVCYCLYTSGTTGTPKGCEITHDNAVQCMLAFQNIFEGHWAADSRWLQFASLHFDVSVLEQYWSWSVGITLVAAPRDLILEDLAGTISRLEITHIDLTPSLARLIHPDDVPSLCKGVFITGGESLKQEILDVWGSKAVIYNFYGPTEATIGVTVYPRVPQNGRASNIGKQFINVGSYVLKPGTDEPVLRGAVGELCVSGKLVGKGYLKRDELTAERFPILPQFGERVYRTGDLVRLLHDGCFDFLGRADDQVKLRGQRLEIGEINHAIKIGVKDIKDVATIVVRSEKQHKDFLVSFIVTEKRKDATRQELKIIEGHDSTVLCQQVRVACRSKLPGYMVPTYVFRLPFIPLSPNNKAEIKHLRKLFTLVSQDQLVSSHSPDEASGNEPTEMEKKIIDVLGTIQFIDAGTSASSNIFELGIDSISVLRFSQALKREGIHQSNPAVIMRHPVVSDLAQALESQRTSTSAASAWAARQTIQACGHRHRSYVCRELGVLADQIEYIAPCSPLQQGMISRSAVESAYFNTFRFKLANDADTKLLKQAWQRVVDAFAVLRTVFVGTTDGFVQVSMKKLELPWMEVKTGRQLEPEAQTLEDLLQEKRSAWIAKNEENLKQPLEIIMVVEDKGSSVEHLLVLQIFHGLYDANSFDLITTRVAEEYQGLVGAHSGEGLTPQDSFLVDQHPSTSSGPTFLDALCHGPLQAFSVSKPFWVDHLSTATFEPIAISHAETQHNVSSCEGVVNFKALETVRTTLGVTHQAIIQAAWVWVLAKEFSVDPTIGMITSGRAIELDGAEKVVGPLFNTLPFHANIRLTKGKAGLNWAALVRKCHEFNTAVLGFQHTPLREIQKWCSSGKQLFDILFSFQRQDEVRTSQHKLWAEMQSVTNADYPLALEATLASDNRLTLLLVGKGELLANTTLQSLMDGLQTAFVAMEDYHDGSLQSLDMDHIGTGILEQLVTEVNLTTCEGERNQPLAQTSFTWTEKATMIRNEISVLAEVSIESVTELSVLFELGLDSIDMIKLSARLKGHGIKIKPSQLMKAQTIPAILAIHYQCEESNGHETTTGASKNEGISAQLMNHIADLGVDVGGVEAVFPATPLQDSMVAEMLDSDFQLYFNHDVLEISQEADLGRLEEAWKTVIAGLPILRTQFLAIDSVEFDFAYCQIVERTPVICVKHVELGAMDDLHSIMDTATDRARRGGGHSDLLQLTFVNIRGQRFLVLSIAHALYDGQSLGLIHQDVRAAYAGRYTPRQFYEAYLEQIMASTSQDGSEFWSEFLDGASATIFPENKPARSGEMAGTVFRAEGISSLAASDVRTFCKSHAITLQALGQACWAALLATRTKSLDVTFGVVLSGRDSDYAEALAFPTMNSVAVRSVLHGTVSSWLRYMQDNITNIASFQHFPLRKAQTLVRGSGSNANGALFNTLFIQQRVLGTSGEEDRDALVKSISGASAVEYPVCVEMEVSERNLVWRTACDAKCVSREETTVLLHQLDVVLGHFLSSPETDVLSFSGQNISICGLPSFSPASADTTADVAVDGVTDATSTIWSPDEDTIRSVLAKVSGVPLTSILKSHNIFHLGLDSISAIKASSLLRKSGLTIGFRDLLKAKSISDMAAISQSLGAAEHSEQLGDGLKNRDIEITEISVDLIPDESTRRDIAHLMEEAGIDEAVVEEVLPATPMQVHMLSVWQNTNGEVFQPEFRYTLTGNIAMAAIRVAWNKLVAETAILRTIFVSMGAEGVPIWQIVVNPNALRQELATAQLWTSGPAETLSQPFNSLKVRHLGGGGKWSLNLKIHHALYDAVSLPSLMRRFVTLCSISSSTRPDAYGALHIEELYTSERLLSTTIRDQGSDKESARQQFWTEYLAGVTSTPLSLAATDDSQQQQQGDEPDVRVSHLERPAVPDIRFARSVSVQIGVSIQSLFFAAYAKFLASTGAKETVQSVVFGVYLANRGLDIGGGLSLPYPTLRLLPLRVDVGDGKEILEIALNIQLDLHKISTPGLVDVGLWEIKQWTGVVVDSFVNFLSVPLLDDEEIWAEDEDGNEITLEETMGEVEHNVQHIEHVYSKELARNPVRDAYPVCCR